MMNKNLYTKELRRNQKNTLIWGSIVIGFTFMILSIYPFMAEMGQDLHLMLESMPEEISKAMGMDKDTWASILGFYSTYYGIYIIVLVGIYTTSTGATIVSKEERDGTSEFLLTRPMSRSTVFWSKMYSLFTLVVIVYILQSACAVVGMIMFSEGTMDWNVFTVMHVHGLFLILFFTCIGVLISMFVKPKKNFMGMVVGIVFGSYFLNALAMATDATKWLGYLSPFHYVDFSVNDPNYSINYLAGLCMTVIGFLMLYISFRVYKNKDMAG